MNELEFVCDTAGERIDAWLSGRAELERSRSYIEKLIKQGAVTMDGNAVTKPSLRTAEGSRIVVAVPEPVSADALPQNIDIDIIYEDSYIVVVNKPRGMVTHPGAGNEDGTLVNALLYKCAGKLSDIGGVVRPGIVHRLDKDTSGIIVAAKTNQAHERFSAMLANREIHKKYAAIVSGVIDENSGVIDAPIGRSTANRLKMCVDTAHGREAKTRFEVRERFNKYTFLSVQIFTGRTHQIRVHMNYIGHPVAGDPLYGRKDGVFDKCGGQLLHAEELEFVHPITGENMHFNTGIPPYMQTAIEKIRERGL